MGKFNRAGREQKMYVEDYPEAKVWPLDSVPSERSKNSWTNGVKAWTKKTATDPAYLVGWFTQPRLRKGRTITNRMVASVIAEAVREVRAEAEAAEDSAAA